jgi:hypothetical protein
VSATGIFGAGLTNGHPDAAPSKIGLFAFNPAVRVTPNFMLNARAGSTCSLAHRSIVVAPTLYIVNVFDATTF